MNRKPLILIILMVLMTIVSCDEPDTVVTNFVHPDGSVTRRIEMKSFGSKDGERFKMSDIQVPFDDTWNVKDSLEISDKGDTTWVRRAEKLFENTEAINLSYKSDSGANRDIMRKTEFKRRFRWFNTEFRFAEKIDNKMEFGYPLADFLSKEEQVFFYSPESVKGVYQDGPDSTKFKAFGDTIGYKTGLWITRSIVSEWIGCFLQLTAGKAENDFSFQTLKNREVDFVNALKNNEEDFDSLWSNGIILRELIGENNALKFKTEADSAIAIATNNLLLNFREYSVRLVMPGKLTGTNGFIDSSATLLWPVKSDFFLTEPYEMWAESKILNWWAWVISGLFLVFVSAGLLIRKNKKG